MKYKFINFEKSDRKNAGRPVYYVKNNKTGVQLGVVYYEKKWRKYAIYTREGIIFDDKCLKDIIDFMENHAGKGD